jgi:hypothetical protein
MAGGSFLEDGIEKGGRGRGFSKRKKESVSLLIFRKKPL